ncbi:hypothetical protein Tco_1013059, partial [Tanacetum coccineum]
FFFKFEYKDDSGTISLTLFNDEVQSLADADECFPIEILVLICKRFSFKVVIDEFNAKKLLPVFNVLQPENEATSFKTPCHYSTDLGSQTDENTTPTNALKSTTTSPPEKAQNRKHPSVEDPSSECSNTKRKLVDIQEVEDPGSECSKTKGNIVQVMIEKDPRKS